MADRFLGQVLTSQRIPEVAIRRQVVSVKISTEQVKLLVLLLSLGWIIFLVCLYLGLLSEFTVWWLSIVNLDLISLIFISWRFRANLWDAPRLAICFSSLLVPICCLSAWNQVNSLSILAKSILAHNFYGFSIRKVAELRLKDSELTLATSRSSFENFHHYWSFVCCSSFFKRWKSISPHRIFFVDVAQV